MGNIKISLLQIKIQESSKFKYHYLCKILIKKKKILFPAIRLFTRYIRHLSN